MTSFLSTLFVAPRAGVSRARSGRLTQFVKHNANDWAGGVSQSGIRKIDNFLGTNHLTRGELNSNADELAEHVVRHSNRRDTGHALILAHDVLNLSARDVLAATDDHVLR